MRASLTAGIEARTVAKTAVKTMLTAANGKASFSLDILAAPKLCPAAPRPRPRDTGSVTPQASRVLAPIMAANMPVSTQRTAAIEVSPPSNFAITMARAVVILRGMVERRTIQPSDPPIPRARTNAAVPKRPPALPITTPVVTVERFDAITPLRLYMAMANEMTAGPSMYKMRSPAPAVKAPKLPHLYSLRTSTKEEPVATPMSLAVRKVMPVLVRMGWRNLVTAAGIRAPQMKDVKVAKPMKMV
mmetsp:Transcript_5203/g.14750  ORF Transcript_5203/g.14750 Transcript_5203/m.14750 type:complete len:245 (-) Transcript_5203:791-1525(-)